MFGVWTELRTGLLYAFVEEHLERLIGTRLRTRDLDINSGGHRSEIINGERHIRFFAIRNAADSTFFVSPFWRKMVAQLLAKQPIFLINSDAWLTEGRGRLRLARPTASFEEYLTSTAANLKTIEFVPNHET